MFSLTFIASGLALSRISTNSQFLLPLINSALLKQHETVKALLGCVDSRGDGKGIEKCWLLVSNVFRPCPGGSVWMFLLCIDSSHNATCSWVCILLEVAASRTSTVCTGWSGFSPMGLRVYGLQSLKVWFCRRYPSLYSNPCFYVDYVVSFVVRTNMHESWILNALQV